MLDYMKNYMDLFKEYFKGSLYKDIFNSTNDYCLAVLYVFVGYLEHQTMTRFMYPNIKLKKTLKPIETKKKYEKEILKI